MTKTLRLISLIFIFSTFGCDRSPELMVEKTAMPITEESPTEDRKLPIEINEQERSAISAEQEDEDLAPKPADVQQKTLDQLRKESEALKRKLHQSPKKDKIHFVVVGSFRTQEFQNKMEKRIKIEKLQYEVVPKIVHGQKVNTIKIGPLESSQSATELLNELKTKGFPEDSFVE